MNPRIIDTLTITARFNGPPGSGNGGYVCGLLANYIEGTARVRLMRPPPLDRPLAVIETATGVELHDGDQPIARGWQQDLELEPRPAPPVIEARRASQLYPGFKAHAFSTCFVCGPQRAEQDGLRIFPGPYDDPKGVACTWTPDAGLADAAGRLATHFIWAALDCPTGWAWLHAVDEPALLGEFSVRVIDAPRTGTELVLLGWRLDRMGRKMHSASALYSEAGRALAVAHATWIRLAAA